MTQARILKIRISIYKKLALGLFILEFNAKRRMLKTF